MRAKKELLFFAILIIVANSFIFGAAVFLLAKLESMELFEYALFGALFIFSTTLPIYFAGELIESALSPVKNFRFLIEDTMHEINTPVATIKTNAAMLKKNASAADLKRCQRIELACDKLLTLYENLEYFAKKEAKLSQKIDISLKDVMLQEIAIHEDAFAKKGVLLKIIIEDEILSIDKKGFSLALSNLLSNALKFSESGKSVEVSFAGGTLKVKDEGRGIAEDELIKIFDRYYQENGAKEGRGIGLFLVKEFCDENNVGLFIRSNVGLGSEFTLDFDKIRKKT
ncbi:MAG TPA: HAMP domain-containing sensor histidine kinase [Campylobacterales bacterium]|nr:HAMP domain-containing sensor histidine kinase [Campylobacterales bacterium]